MARAADITVEILKQIRDGVTGTNQRLESVEQRLGSMDRRLETVEHRLGAMDRRLESVDDRMGTIEGALLDLAQQHRFLVRGFRALSDRDGRFESDVDDLRARVEAIEKRLG